MDWKAKMGFSDNINRWKTVKNAVASRMKDNSLIHKLIPYREISKTTKAMNYTLSRLTMVKTYSEYVKIKTSILQNVARDIETDDSDSFSDEDYRRVYKLDLSLRNCVKRRSKTNKSYADEEDSSYVQESSYDEDTPLDRVMIAKARRAKIPKVKKPIVDRQNHDVVNLGWQNVVKKKKRTARSIQRKLDKCASTSSNGNSMNKSISQTTVQSNALEESLTSNVEKNTLHDHGTLIVEPITTSLASTTQTSCATVNNVDTIKSEPMSEGKKEFIGTPSNVNQCHNISESNRSGAVENIKKNLMQDLNDCNEKYNNQNLFNGNKNLANDTFLDKTQLSLANINPVDQSTPIQSKRKLSQAQQLMCKIAQPKDSGIDDDSEVESSEDRKHVTKKLKSTEIKQKIQTRTPKRKHSDSEKEDLPSSLNVGKCITQKLEIDTEETKETAQATTSNYDQNDSEEESTKFVTCITQKLDIHTEEANHSTRIHSSMYDQSDSEEESSIVGKCITQKLPDSSEEAHQIIQASSSMYDQSDSEEESSVVGKCITQKLDVSREEANHSMQVSSSMYDPSDSEEESSVVGKCITQKLDVSAEESNQSMPPFSLVLEHSESEEESSEDGKSINKNLKTKTVSNENEHSDEIHKQKLHPTVTCTEIVRKRYKIITGDVGIQNVNKKRKISEDVTESCEEEVLVKLEEQENVEEDEHMEDHMSLASKRKVQKLKRLNLTADSESSLSDESTGHHDIDRTRRKSLDRSEINFHLSDSDNEIVVSEKSVLRHGNKDGRTELNISKHSNNYEKGSNSDKDQMINNKKSNNDISKDMRRDSSCENLNERHRYDKPQTTSERNSAEINTSQDYASDTSETTKATEQLNEETEEITSHQKDSTAKAVSRKRPCNLEEFATDEELVQVTTPSNFTFKDINEDELFILDIPVSILQSQLMGEKIVLTEKKLKLGKQKYKVSYKNVNVVSCVFGTGKSRKPYKAVNIKPVAMIMTRQKIEKSPTKSSTESHTETGSCTESTTDAERNTHTPKKQRREKKRSSTKRKRLISFDDDVTTNNYKKNV